MERRCWVILAILSFFSGFAQQDSVAMHYANTMTEEHLREYLTVLASDAYEGRETGMRGQKMAADYIMEHFQQFGIPPVPNAESVGLAKGYQLPYPVTLNKPGGVSLAMDGKPLGFMQDYFYFGQKMVGELRATSVVFAGFGVNDGTTNDYRTGNTHRKVVLVLQDATAEQRRGDSHHEGFFQMLTRTSAAAEASGASVLLIARPDAREIMAEYARYITTPKMGLGANKSAAPIEKHELQTIIIDQTSAELILRKAGLSWRRATRQAHKRAGQVLGCSVLVQAVPDKQDLTAENVLGFIEGSDKKEEIILITAHYDHLGKSGNEVYNGADDDGSGTVSVMELSRAFALAKAEGHGPRRSMLFMTVSGEEKGLLGSQWYSEHPVFPLANTVADLNIDMVGRVDSAHLGKDHYVYVIGSDRLSTQLHSINELVNAKYTKLDLDYTFDSESDPNRFYYRSDHYNFARFGVPIIFYFNGVHEDYHQPGDEVGKIRFDLLRQRAQLVFYTAWELADREERILVDKPIKKE